MSISFYIACILGALLIYTMIQYGKEIEHNRELDMILKIRTIYKCSDEEPKNFDLIRAVLCDRIADENTIEDWRKRNDE